MVFLHVHLAWLLAAFMVCGMANRADDITAHPNDVTVREGDAAEFSCTASRSPDEHVSPLLIVWKLNNSLVDPERPYVGTELHLSDGGSVATGILRIKQTDRSRDFGLYRCTVISSSLPVDSKPAHLTFVKDSPGLFVEAPVNVSVRVGTTATLRCQPPSSLASSKVTWEKDRQVLRSGGRIRILVRAGVHRFRIKNVLATDVASYVCVAGRSRSRAARLTVQEEPTEAPAESLTVHPNGASVKKGGSVTFQCSSGQFRRVEWFKGNKKLYSRSAAKISVSQSGQLKFKEVLSRHEGDYTCKAVGSPESVTVHLEIAFIGQMTGGSIESVARGTGVSFECSPPQGHPVPTIRWYFGGREIHDDGLKYWSYPGGLFVDQVTDEDAGFYHCVASNLAGNTNITWEVKVVGAQETTETGTPTNPTLTPTGTPISIFQYEPYNVSVGLFDVVRWDCHIRFDLDFATYVWVHGMQTFSNDVTGRVRSYPNGSLVINAIKRDDLGLWTCVVGYGGKFKESHSSAFIHIIEPTGIVPLRFDHDGKPPPKLEIGLGQLHSLPCSAWTVYPPLTITWTKDDIILQRIHSPSSTASNHLTISRTDKSDSGSYFCEVQDRTNVTLLAETRVTVMDPPVVRIVPESVNVNQREEIRLTCEVMSGDGDIALTWRASGWPGLPQSTARRFDENDNGTLVIRNAKTFDANTYFCVASNPGGEGTASANVTVNMVLDVEADPVGDGSSELVPIVPIVAVCGVVYIALMVALGVWCYQRHASNAEQKKSSSQRNDPEAQVVTNGVPSTTEIVRSHLERGSTSTVGSGQYWTVYKAELRKHCSKGDESVVASVLVKELHEEGFNRDRVMKEVKAMKRLHHDNVSALVGVCTDQHPYLLVTENLDQGDLKKYLTELRLSDAPLILHRQVSFLRQIASGLEYLSAQGHIHKDVAARNCLISRDLLLKLSDLSLCVDGYEDDYVSETPAVTGQYRPLRWMSPEAVMKDALTKENDVWSYGVLMWEVTTLARQPYEGMSNIEVVAAVQRGHLLEKRDDCPHDLYEIMQSCWQKVSEERPSFQFISELLHGLQ